MGGGGAKSEDAEDSEQCVSPLGRGQHRPELKHQSNTSRSCCLPAELLHRQPSCPPHLLAVGQGGAHERQEGGRDAHVAVEGQHEELAAQGRGHQAGVQVGVCLLQQRGQQREPDLRGAAGKWFGNGVP